MNDLWGEGESKLTGAEMGNWAAWTEVQGLGAMGLPAAAFSCLVQEGKADTVTQGWDLPAKKWDKEGSLKDGEEVQGH